MLSIDVRSKRFGDHEVLRDIRIDVADGELLCVLGPSGCGKTTLLNIIAGLDTDFAGTVQASNASGDATPPLGPRIGYVFQNPVLLPWRTVRQNLELVMQPGQIEGGLVDRFLDAVGLNGYGEAFPGKLSLGMARRAALARAFAIEPDLLLLDEPFASVDETTAQTLRALLLELWRTKPREVVFVTHDSREAVQLAQRIIVLSSGPAGVLRDVRIELTPEQRADPLHVERLRTSELGLPALL
jgi:NitT/TauT family transport system ATP-binding protein